MVQDLFQVSRPGYTTSQQGLILNKSCQNLQLLEVNPDCRPSFSPFCSVLPGLGARPPDLRALTSTLQLGAALFNCQESRFCFRVSAPGPPGPPPKLPSSKRTFLTKKTRGDGWGSPQSENAVIREKVLPGFYFQTWTTSPLDAGWRVCTNPPLEPRRGNEASPVAHKPLNHADKNLVKLALASQAGCVCCGKV